jgi:hypothetical protein
MRTKSIVKAPVIEDSTGNSTFEGVRKVIGERRGKTVPDVEI